MGDASRTRGRHHGSGPRAGRFRRSRGVAAGGLRWREGVPGCRDGSTRARAPSGFRSRGNRRLRDRAARAPGGCPRELRDLVLRSCRCAGQRLAVQADRCKRRQRVVDEPSQFRIPKRVAAHPHQEAADRIRVGTNARSHAAACRHGRVRRGGRAGRRQGLGVCEPTRASPVAAGACGLSAALRQRVLGASARRARIGDRRQYRDGVAK